MLFLLKPLGNFFPVPALKIFRGWSVDAAISMGWHRGCVRCRIRGACGLCLIIGYCAGRVHSETGWWIWPKYPADVVYFFHIYFIGGENSHIFSMFTPIWGRFLCWLIFCKWVETTNQFIYIDMYIVFTTKNLVVLFFCCHVGLPRKFKVDICSQVIILKTEPTSSEIL